MNAQEMKMGNLAHRFFVTHMTPRFVPFKLQPQRQAQQYVKDRAPWRGNLPLLILSSKSGPNSNLSDEATPDTLPTFVGVSQAYLHLKGWESWRQITMMHVCRGQHGRLTNLEGRMLVGPRLRQDGAIPNWALLQ